MGYTKILSELQSYLIHKIKEAFPHLTDGEIHLQIVLPPDPELGDYAFGCFQLARPLKSKPQAIAVTIAGLVVNSELIAEARADGPYVNIRIHRARFMQSLLEQICRDDSAFGTVRMESKRFAMIEYSSPNTNKPQHLGHVRNNILGMAVGNLLEKTGVKIVRVNLINDRGIHICKTMLAYQRWGEGKTPELAGKKGDHFVGDLYIMFESKAAENKELLGDAQALLRKWEEGDSGTLQVWETMNNWVYQGFNETYMRLGCTFDKMYYESATWKIGKDIVLSALEKGLCYRNAKGDVVINLEEKGWGERVLLRADGTTIYITQDIGTAVQKFQDYGIDQSVYVVASEQNHYFSVLFEVLKRFGYTWADACYHLSYGMVYLPEGRMKSREGAVVDADALMNELKELAHEEIKVRERDIAGGELDMVSEQIGLGALKFYILKVNPQKDIHFDPNESVSFDGATGPYLQYTHARIASLIRNADFSEDVRPAYELLLHNEEMQVALLLSLFPHTIENAAKNYNPAELCSYLYELAKAFNKLYHEHSILNIDNRAHSRARFNLSRAAGIVVKEGLRLLGIDSPERM